MRVHRGVIACALLCASAAACNQLFGIDEANRIDPPGGVGEGGAADVTSEDRDGNTPGPDADAAVDAPPPEQWVFASVGTTAKTEITIA